MSPTLLWKTTHYQNCNFSLVCECVCYSRKTQQFHQIHDHLYQIDLINTLKSSSHPQFHTKIRANFYQAITGPKFTNDFLCHFVSPLWSKLGSLWNTNKRQWKNVPWQVFINAKFIHHVCLLYKLLIKWFLCK